MKEYLIFKWLRELDSFGNTPDGVMRTAFSPEEKEARSYVINLMKSYDLEVRTDAVGNTIGRTRGYEMEQPAVIIGSHLDSVPRGGRYDGVLGVLSGMEVVRYLWEKGLKSRFPLEVVIFSNEEGCRFSCSLLGSSVMMGEYAKTCSELNQIVDQEGINLAQAISFLGGKPEELMTARRNPKEIKAYLELHIEQGAVLEQLSYAIGIVEGIAAPVRLKLEIWGQADHAGATPMRLRHDALLAAAEITLALEEIVVSTSPTGVGTVGQLNVLPGAVNVIPGYCSLTFDIRDITCEARSRVLKQLKKAIAAACERRGLKYQLEETFSVAPVILDRQIADLIENACAEEGVRGYRMNSGAAHDAMIMANHVPTGMIFVPSVGGVSHSPAEFTREEHIKAGVDVLRGVALRLLDLKD